LIFIAVFIKADINLKILILERKSNKKDFEILGNGKLVPRAPS